MKIWEKDGWVFVQLRNNFTNEMMIDFSVGKQYWNDLKEHIITHLSEFKLSDSGLSGDDPSTEDIVDAVWNEKIEGKEENYGGPT